MRIERFLSIIFMACLVSGCALDAEATKKRYFSGHNLDLPRGDEFQSCRGYGCKHVDQVTLSESEWRAVEAPFQTGAQDSTIERQQIAQSIAVFEQIVGQKTGSHEDRAGTFGTLGPWQQDCVDESTNTSIYMMALQQRGYITQHQVNTPHSRVLFLRWPHQTAVITDTLTGQKYAIDSWFNDNGEPPIIVEFEKWASGWNPDDGD